MNIQELAYHLTPLGPLSLRRRVEPRLGDLVVFEVKLGDEFLMASHFIEGERQVSILGLDRAAGDALDVVVGGLGLGYTAAAALENARVGRLLVIELFDEVISWHNDHLVPAGEILTADERCELRQGDFFALARTGLDANDPARRFDAVLVDIDHTPEHFLDSRNESFYGDEGLRALRDQLKPGGVFALWSDAPADEVFTARLKTVFGDAKGVDVKFPNPYTNSTSLNSVYIAVRS